MLALRRTPVAAWILFAALLGVLPVPAPASPIPGLMIARASTYIPGGDVYNGRTKVAETKTLILPAGSTLTFRNLDVEAHNVSSGDPSAGLEGDGRFYSPTISFNQQTDVTGGVPGVAGLPPGEYRFFCSIHPAKVTGTLVII